MLRVFLSFGFALFEHFKLAKGATPWLMRGNYSELSSLDNMALSHRTLPRLPKSKRCRARQSHGAIRHTYRAIGARFKGVQNFSIYLLNF